MARFIPDTRLEDIAHDSERVVFESLQQLGPDWTVLHSFPWLRPDRSLASEPLHEGEADFVLLHPDRGLLVLEVKGGDPQLSGRTWTRNGRAMRDPFEQARRNRFALLEAIEERTHRRLHRGLLTHGDVVIFPHVRYSGDLPLNTDERVFLDGRDLPDLPTKLQQAAEAWARSPRRLSPTQFSSVIDALLPKLRLLRCAAAEVRSEAHRIVQITLDQRATLLGLLANERVLVQGGAGSGKTLLALEFALTLADRGERVLLLCFNRHLAHWLAEQAAQDPRGGTSPPRLHATNFHSFALATARSAGVEFAAPDQWADDFWDSEVPLILEQALEVLRSRGEAFQFDAVLIDEAQDFPKDWWVPVESLVKRGRRGRLYAFLDQHQSLRGDGDLPPVDLPARFELTTNCRNTRAIARSAATMVNTEVRLLAGAPEGDPPGLHLSQSEASETGIVLREVQSFMRQGVLAKQIALIGPRSLTNGPLSRHHDVEGIPLIDDAADWRRGGGVLVTTARSFKGLEADIVIIYDLTRFGGMFTTTDLYVAWTRARHRLLIVCHGHEVHTFAEQTIAAAERRRLGN